MRLERYADNFVTPSEQEPTSIKSILSRFGFREDDETKRKYPLTHFEAAFLRGFLRGEGGLSFESNVKECPFRNLIMAGSLLVGLTDPKQIDRVNQIFCGTTIEYEDSEGPLSGRRGNVYEPLSHCWRTTIELFRLVEFMREIEELPSLATEKVESEEELKVLLNERSGVKERNEKRQEVFATWTELKNNIEQMIETKDQNSRPALPGKSETSSGKSMTRKVYDAKSQFDIGGLEYMELTNWVQEKVLLPLINLVGEENLHIYLRKKDEPLTIHLGFQKTAKNCPNKPHGGFSGEMF